tara:strand:+ start:255 stop:551 length:297 start_codon:yes stop_codon:yes gene_type:complete
VSGVKVICFACSAEHNFPERVSYREECDKCGADLHVCKTCEFYDPASYNECREPSADPVKDKERANYCDYYRPNSELKGGEDKRSAQLAAAEALFKKK